MAIVLKKGSAVEGMRVAGKVAASILAGLGKCVLPGVTTREIDRIARELIAKNGAKSAFLGYRGFPGNVCISVNNEVIHGIGSTRVLQMGDLVKLDVGVSKDGWIGDTAATFACGMVSIVSRNLMLATEAALSEGVRNAVAGGRIGDISEAVESEVIRHGFSVVRDFVGHGVGRSLHEDPQVPNYGKKGSGPKLKENMVIAIEPMINVGTKDVIYDADGWTVRTKDGKYSAHYEHTVCIKRGKADVLSSFESIVAAEIANTHLFSGY